MFRAGLQAPIPGQTLNVGEQTYFVQPSYNNARLRDGDVAASVYIVAGPPRINQCMGSARGQP